MLVTKKIRLELKAETGWEESVFRYVAVRLRIKFYSRTLILNDVSEIRQARAIVQNPETDCPNRYKVCEDLFNYLGKYVQL